jgi:hypothetical protein
MDIKNLTQDYDPDLMETKEAGYLKNHIEDFHEELYGYLVSNNILFNFIAPFLNGLLDSKQNYINSKMDRFEARSLATKEAIEQMDQFFNNSSEIKKIKRAFLEKFDLDKNTVIDSENL